MNAFVEYDVCGDLNSLCRQLQYAAEELEIPDELLNDSEDLSRPTESCKPVYGKTRSSRRSKKPATEVTITSSTHSKKLPTPNEDLAVTLKDVNNIIEGPLPKKRGRPKRSCATTTEAPIVAAPKSPRRSTTATARRGRRARGAQCTTVPNSSGCTPGLIELETNSSSRRREINERAAHATSVGFIDLIESPIVPVQGFINLDSDEEADKKEAESKKKPQPTVEEMNDEDNPVIDVKVMWDFEFQVIPLRKYQKFAHLINVLAEKYKCPAKQVICNLDDCLISVDDTLASINYKKYYFIHARKVSVEALAKLEGTGTESSTKTKVANQISLKIQSDKWKRPKIMEILKDEKFNLLYIQCAEELNMAKLCFKLHFDGEVIPPDSTPNMLELDGGEIIDLFFLN